MSIKIIATNLKEFTELEKLKNEIGEDLIKKFEQIEYYVGNIRLTTIHYFDNEINLPRGFVIERVNNNEYKEYEKDAEGNIIEKTKYTIEITGELEGKRLNIIAFISCY
jgi:hypothetical protein